MWDRYSGLARVQLFGILSVTSVRVSQRVSHGYVVTTDRHHRENHVCLFQTQSLHVASMSPPTARCGASILVKCSGHPDRATACMASARSRTRLARTGSRLHLVVVACLPNVVSTQRSHTSTLARTRAARFEVGEAENACGPRGSLVSTHNLLLVQVHFNSLSC